MVEGQIIVVHVDGRDIGHGHVQTHVCVRIHQGDDVVARSLNMLDIAGRFAVQHPTVDFKINVGEQRERFKAGNIFEGILIDRVEVVGRPGLREVHGIVTGQAVHDERVGKVGCRSDFKLVVTAVGGIAIGNVDARQRVEAGIRAVKVGVHHVTA